jgi:hypothetical protein
MQEVFQKGTSGQWEVLFETFFFPESITTMVSPKILKKKVNFTNRNCGSNCEQNIQIHERKYQD